MDNFSPAQYDQFEACRRHALPKQAVRKVIQRTVGQKISQPVAQIIAGFFEAIGGQYAVCCIFPDFTSTEGLEEVRQIPERLLECPISGPWAVNITHEKKL